MKWFTANCLFKVPLVRMCLYHMLVLPGCWFRHIFDCKEAFGTLFSNCIMRRVFFPYVRHMSFTFLYFWQREELVTVSNSMNRCCLSSKPEPFLRGIFPFIKKNIFCLFATPVSTSFLSPACWIALRNCVSWLAGPPSLFLSWYLPLLMSGGTWVAVFLAFGLMWALQWGSLGIVPGLSVHYCGYMTF